MHLKLSAGFLSMQAAFSEKTEWMSFLGETYELKLSMRPSNALGSTITTPRLVA